MLPKRLRNYLTPEQAAALTRYHSTPEFQMYLNARDAWELAHNSYVKGGANRDELFSRLVNAEAVKDSALESARKTPQHLAAFGY